MGFPHWARPLRLYQFNLIRAKSMNYLITLIGLVLILEALPYVAFPEAMQNWLKQLVEMNPSVLRILGLLGMGTGLLLCYITQRTNLI